MAKIKKSKIIIFLGKPGSGKGAQADLLAKLFGLERVASGALLRERGKEKDFTGEKLSIVIDKGGLSPTAIIFKLWADKFEKLKNKKNFKGLIMDGSPRKILEARLIDETLVWYGWAQNVKVFLIDISSKEAIRRLLKRARNDDTLAGIKKRLAWFKTDVQPVINYYQKTRGVLKINGEQSVEKVFRDIIGSL